MAIPFRLCRASGSIVRPTDTLTEEALITLFPEGVEFVLEYHPKRNYSIHKGYFEYLTKVHRNLPEELSAKYPTMDNFRIAMQIAAGHYDTTNIKIDGVWYELKIPKSIRFDKMDNQVEFDRLFNKVREVTRELLEQYGWDVDTFVAVTGERLY